MPLYRHRFSGTCAAGDIFVFSWWSDSTLSTEQANTAAQNWANILWNGDGTNPGYGTHVTADVTLTAVATGEVDINTGRQQTLAESSVDWPGTATGSAMPADVAVVVTLRSILANRSGRGRFYLPQPAVSTASSLGRIGVQLQGDLVNILQAAWSDAVAAGLTPIVYSRTYRAIRVVSQYGVGDLYDTQRRRENQINESRSMLPMP